MSEDVTIVRMIAVGASTGKGFDTINDHEMSDGTTRTMSTSEAQRHPAVLKVGPRKMTT